MDERIEIPLTRGMVAWVSPEDAERVLQFKWHVKPSKYTYYAGHQIMVDGVKQPSVFMHNFILGVPMVDHKDGNGLNNTRGNIRPANRAQNAANRAGWAVSGYKGVRRSRKRWRAVVGYGNRVLQLGTYDTAEEAARAYDAAATKYFGEFARLNFPT